MALHVWGLFTHPDQEWRSIREEKSSVVKTRIVNVVILAIISAIYTCFGTTVTGWPLTDSPVDIKQHRSHGSVGLPGHAVRCLRDGTGDSLDSTDL